MQETLNEQQLQKKYEELDKSKRPERAERVIRFLDKIGNNESIYFLLGSPNTFVNNDMWLVKLVGLVN